MSTETTRPGLAEALFRYSVASPLLEAGLSEEDLRIRRRRILQSTHLHPDGRMVHVSERTLRRWIASYRAHGLDGLFPSLREVPPCQAIPAEVLQLAVDLRKEAPSRSVQQIIKILERAGKIEPGSMSSSTLGRQFRRLHATRQEVAKEKQRARHRFTAKHRNALWTSDVHHALWLPDEARPDQRKKAYLVIFLDDFSRVPVGCRFYFHEKVPMLEDCFRRALLKHGLPNVIYVDNGSAYKSKQFHRICAEFGIRLIHTKPYDPQAKGKCERWWRTFDLSFLPEVNLLIKAGELTTLDELNRLLWIWIQEEYLPRPHRVLKMSPQARYDSDPQPLRIPGLEQVRHVFLWREHRRVDQTGCISLLGNIYEVDHALAGKTVELAFDPFELSIIQVWHEKQRLSDAVPFQMRRGHHPAVQPPQAPPTVSTGLNFLSLLAQHHEEKMALEAGKIDFCALAAPKGDDDLV